MRLIPQKRWLRLSTGAALAVSLILVSSTTASARTQHHHHRSQAGPCIVFDDLTEPLIRYEATGLGPNGEIQLGTIAKYWDDILNASGRKIGSTVGDTKMIYQNPADGHLFQYYHEKIALPGGTLEVKTTIDRHKMLADNFVRFPLTGKSGVFYGKVGYRDVQLNWPETSTAWITMVLCDKPRFD